MTDTTTAPVTDPGPPPPRPDRPPRMESPFFSWLRGLGVPRTRGWLGGVCGGLATRMGIDPAIVRGMFVVAALIGFPALLLYAIAWMLLPDLEGRIPAQEAARGRFEPALVAAAVMVLLTFIPIVPWVWSALFWPLSGSPWWPFGLGGFAQVASTALTVLLIAGVVGLVIWLAVRASHSSRGGTVPDPRTASADSAAPGLLSDPIEVVDDQAVADESPDTAGPDVAPADSTGSDELAAWRVRQDEWRTQRDAWRRQQAQLDAVAREQSRSEREEAGRRFAAEADARRAARRAANPRASAVFVIAVLGAALAGGAIAALAVGERGPAIAATAGILVAALISAIGMVVAGASRRRSGFLAFCSMVLLLAGIVTGAFSAAGRVVFPSTAVTAQEVEGTRILQPFGSTTLWLLPSFDGGRNDGVVIRKGVGDTEIRVEPGVTLELDATLGDGSVTYTRVGRDGSLMEQKDVPAATSIDGVRRYAWTVTVDDPDLTSYTVPVHVDQNGGTITIVAQEGAN